MDLSGIQYILDVFAHQELLIMEIGVFNAPMIKDGFQASDAHALRDLLIVELLVNI